MRSDWSLVFTHEGVDVVTQLSHRFCDRRFNFHGHVLRSAFTIPMTSPTFLATECELISTILKRTVRQGRKIPVHAKTHSVTRVFTHIIRGATDRTTEGQTKPLIDSATRNSVFFSVGTKSVGLLVFLPLWL